TVVKPQTIELAVTSTSDSSTHSLKLTAPQNTAVKPQTITPAAASPNDSAAHSLKLTAPQNTAVNPKTIKLAAASPNDSSTHSLQLTTTLPAQDCSSSHNKMPDSAVLVICTNNETLETYTHCLSINTQEPMPQLLGNLIERGVARKLYLTITLEKEMQLEALVDTGSDLTLISAQLFQKLKFEAQRQNRTLKFHTCELNVQSYSQNDIQLRNLAPIHLAIGPMSIVHPVYISPMNTYQFLIGKDLLDRFEPLLDFKHLQIWAQVREPLPLQPHKSIEPECQATKVCTLINEQGTVVPAYTKGVAVRLNLRQGQTLNHTLAFFQPSPECVELGLTLEATPLTEVSSRVVYILFNNCTAADISIPKAYRLGWLVSNDFHDFELILPVIGPIPPALIPEGHTDNTLFTAPFQFIAITSVMSVAKHHVCRTELTEDQHLTVYTVSHQPVETNPTDDKPTEEQYQGFELQVQQILQDADALQDDADRQRLKQVLYKFKESFAKDSLDCGLTDLHTVRIPTHPEAPPTFVKQYKIPIASHEPVREIIESMLEKNVIRACNSTYSAPLWPVLKPNGKWRPTIDYRKLNQQVPLSRKEDCPLNPGQPSLALYHLPSEEYQAELEIPSFFKNRNFTLDPELEDWIEKGGPQVIDIAPLDSALQALSRLPILNTSPVVQTWTAADTALCITSILGHALALGLAYILYKRINAIRTSTAKLTEAVSVGFRRNLRKDDSPLEQAEDLIELTLQS
ncbi:hypothetical protein PO909_013033, partial [Leuciscus waleckii]